MSFVKDFMTTDIITVESHETALKAAVIMSNNKVSSLLVVEQKKPIGMITERDFLRKLTAHDKKPQSVTVNELMTCPLVTIEPDAHLKDAVMVMRENAIRRLVVFESGHLKGIVTLTDISKYLL